METLTKDTIRSLIESRRPPCISVYQPTHRYHPDNQQDQIRFKNLIRVVTESLRQKYPSREVDPLVAPLKQLATDSSFWNHTLDGLAVLATAESLRVFRLQQPVRELAIVADTYHVKPLLRLIQSADRFQVLCLTRETAKVYEGNRYALDPLDADDFPATLTAALGDQRTEPHQSVRSHGQQVGGTAMRHGHGSRKDEIEKDVERYFRAVDRSVMACFSKPSGLHLVLAALTQHHSIFRGVSKNPALLPIGVEGNPQAMPADQLRKAAWKAVEPQYLTRLAELSAAFHAAAARQKGTSNLSDAAQAAVQGRVATLLIEADKEIPGRLDPTTGAVKTDSLQDPEVGDLLDDLAEVALRTGGEVVVIPTDQMPASSGLAAIYKF